MDAVTLIQDNLDVEKLLTYYKFDRVRSDGDLLRACCKLHGGDNPSAFVINKYKGLWYCHTGGCGGGDAFTLVQELEGVDFYTATRILSEILKLDISDMKITARKNNSKQELENFIKVMRGRKKKDLSPFTIEEEIKNVVKYRNFREETLKFFQVGFVEKVTLYKRNQDKYTLYNRLAFPIMYKGVQAGISFRSTRSGDYPKWSHQPAHIEIKNMLYNYDNVQQLSTITVCEGITDVLAFHECGIPAAATFGAHITEGQYRLLLGSGADLVLAFDGDDAGRKATSQAVKLFRYKSNLFLLSFFEGEDPESLPREELSKRYANIHRF